MQTCASWPGLANVLIQVGGGRDDLDRIPPARAEPAVEQLFARSSVGHVVALNSDVEPRTVKFELRTRGGWPDLTTRVDDEMR